MIIPKNVQVISIHEMSNEDFVELINGGYDPRREMLTMSEEMITISKKEYQELLKDSLKLQALDAGGVDNWDWYDEAMHDYDILLVEHGLED